MDVKNSPAGHVTEKCAIRQMSFSTDDDNEYDELAHLFTPQNKQNLPASSGDEMKLKTAATKRLTKAKAGYRRLSTPILELSWFFWIVVFLSVWVIYTTSA